MNLFEVPDEEPTESLVKLDETVEKVEGGKANVILDATVMSTLMGCPRKADFRFNHNLVPIGGKSNSLECGSIVHTFLEYFYKSIINGVSRTQAVGFGMAAAELYIKGCKFCKDFEPSLCGSCAGQGVEVIANCQECGGKGRFDKPHCGHKPDEFPGVQNTQKENEGNYIGWEYVLQTCDEYQKFWINDFWVPLQVEHVKGAILYEDDEVRVLWKAKLDWIGDTTQGIFPMDHKTMKQNRQSNANNNQFIGQCLVMGTRSVVINKIGFQKTLPAKEKFVRTMQSYSATRLMEWQSETLPFYAKLLLMYNEGGHFPPNFQQCEGKYGFCEYYKEVCNQDPGMRESQLKQFFMVGREWNPTNDDD